MDFGVILRKRIGHNLNVLEILQLYEINSLFNGNLFVPSECNTGIMRVKAETNHFR